MERINKIWNHPLYQMYRKRTEELETDRVFCKHDMVHFLDVCRLAEILWLRDLSKKVKVCTKITTEMIYAAGLLHDIGRWQEYENGIRHEKASALLAPQILEDCTFNKEEIQEIVEAISNHRNSAVKEEKTLSGFLYRADKMSRPCYACNVEEICDWDENKKNLKIIF